MTIAYHEVIHIFDKENSFQNYVNTVSTRKICTAEFHSDLFWNLFFFLSIFIEVKIQAYSAQWQFLDDMQWSVHCTFEDNVPVFAFRNIGQIEKDLKELSQFLADIWLLILPINFPLLLHHALLTLLWLLLQLFKEALSKSHILWLQIKLNYEN
jgi:hypothetical protein